MTSKNVALWNINIAVWSKFLFIAMKFFFFLDVKNVLFDFQLR